MIQTIRRLYPRGAANRGVCVDVCGAMLGPDWSLVERISVGYRVAPRSASRDIQKTLRINREGADWLYAQGQRIASALSRGEIALAQIYGLRIPIGNIDQQQLKRLSAIATLTKAGFNPDEPRIPAGEPGGGEWTDGDGGAGAPSVSVLQFDESPASSSPPSLVGGRWPAPAGANANPLLFPVQAEEDENGRGGLLGDFMDLPLEFRLDIYEALRARLEAIDPGNPALESLTGPDYSPTQADIDGLSEALREAQERAGEPPATEWQLGWGARGIALELQRLGGQRALPFNTPTIDTFSVNGVAVSIKSIDLNAPWYANPLNLSRQIDSYVDKLSAFNAMNWGNVRIDEEQISGRVLDIVVPINSGTQAQRDAVARSIERAWRSGVYVTISYY